MVTASKETKTSKGSTQAAKNTRARGSVWERTNEPVVSAIHSFLENHPELKTPEEKARLAETAVASKASSPNVVVAQPLLITQEGPRLLLDKKAPSKPKAKAPAATKKTAVKKAPSAKVASVKASSMPDAAAATAPVLTVDPLDSSSGIVKKSPSKTKQKTAVSKSDMGGVSADLKKTAAITTDASVTKKAPKKEALSGNVLKNNDKKEGVVDGGAKKSADLGAQAQTVKENPKVASSPKPIKTVKSPASTKTAKTAKTTKPVKTTQSSPSIKTADLDELMDMTEVPAATKAAKPPRQPKATAAKTAKEKAAKTAEKEVKVTGKTIAETVLEAADVDEAAAVPSSSAAVKKTEAAPAAAPAPSSSQTATPTTPTKGTGANQSEMRAVIHAFRSIGAPLLAAVTEVRALAGDDQFGSKGENDASAFLKLVEVTTLLSRQVSERLGAAAMGHDDWIRWTIAGSASTVVAAYYRATGKPLAPTDAEAFAAAVHQAATAATDFVPAMTDPLHNLAFLRSKILEAMAPVVAAVSRYAFGRPEQALIGEIASRLQRTATEVTQVLAPRNASPDDWRLLFATALEVAGNLYAESHYSEADRLVEMSPDERAGYLARNNNQVPMTPVWTSFDMNVTMLTAIAGYLKVPAEAQLDELKVS